MSLLRSSLNAPKRNIRPPVGAASSVGVHAPGPTIPVEIELMHGVTAELLRSLYVDLKLFSRYCAPNAQARSPPGSFKPVRPLTTASTTSVSVVWSVDTTGNIHSFSSGFSLATAGLKVAFCTPVIAFDGIAFENGLYQRHPFAPGVFAATLQFGPPRPRSASW